MAESDDSPFQMPTDEEIRRMTPGQRIALTWELTKEEWRRKEPGWQETPLRRDVARVIRRKS
jgi:hypothetical protein